MNVCCGMWRIHCLPQYPVLFGLCLIIDNTEFTSVSCNIALMHHFVVQRGAAGVTKYITSSNLQCSTTNFPLAVTAASKAQARRSGLLQCRSSPKQTDSSSNEPGYNYSDPVNKFLGQFLPSSQSARDELSVDFSQNKLRGLSIEQMARLVEEGLSKTQWFVTGEVDPRQAAIPANTCAAQLFHNCSVCYCTACIVWQRALQPCMPACMLVNSTFFIWPTPK